MSQPYRPRHSKPQSPAVTVDDLGRYLPSDRGPWDVPVVTRPQDIRQENVPQGVALAPYADVPLSETFWDAARDYADDGKLTKQTREKLVRTLRTALQGVAAAVVVAVAPMAWDLVQGQPTQLGDLVTAAKVAAVTTLISYVHPKAKK